MRARAKQPTPRRRGITAIYTVLLFSALVAVASLAVDVGRVMLAGNEAQNVADACARAAALGILDSTSYAKANAIATISTIDGTKVSLQASDVVTGTWNATTKVFTAGGTTPNAVKVTINRTAARSNAIPLSFASIFGAKTCNVSQSSIATVYQASAQTFNAPSLGDPWLAGMPSGTTANWYDSAPTNSPTKANITLTAGQALNFKFTGNANNGPGINMSGPDGNTGWVLDNAMGAEHGMSDLTCPITAVVGVFLDDGRPDQEGTPPPALDFSTDASRDFTTLSPQLRQPFFIGDGLRNDGVTQQNFIVPTGATRLFISIMDGYQWSNNAGYYVSTITPAPVIKLVK